MHPIDSDMEYFYAILLRYFVISLLRWFVFFFSYKSYLKLKISKWESLLVFILIIPDYITLLSKTIVLILELTSLFFVT